VIDQAAVDKWYTWTGGPSDTHPWPSDNWNPDNGNHNGFPQGPGVYQRDKGNSGNSDWFYHEVVAEQSHVVHHDAVTHVVHHDAVTHQEFKFAFDHPAITCPPPPPSDACPNLDGIQQDGFPCSKEPVVVNVSDSKSDCDGVFSREGTQTTTYEFVDGDWQASVGDPVWGDWTKVRDLTYQEQVEHQCTTPQPEAVVQETSSTSYHCGESHSTTTIVTTTTEYVSSDGGVTWTLGEPVTTTHTEQADHDVVACPGPPNGPKPPVTNVVDTLPTATLPTATLPNTGGPNRIALGLGLALLVLGGAAVAVSRRKTA
jgi:LPXTG-motif cell wall-anchored protein